ncbi:MAG: BT4734/BF3469 family protein, partial [Prevotella pectinovora]
MYKTKISVYPSCLSTLVHNDVTLSEVYDKIKNDDVLRQRTVNYRKAIEAKLPAKQLKKLKAEQFPMLMPAARFKEGRDMEHLDSYTGLCQCDIDNIPPDMMDEAKRRVRSLPFVCMYHVSMSGKGLHIYYFYQIPNEGLTPQVYQQAFIQGNECIGKAIPADYDAAVGKANHGSSICHDPEAWFNPDAEPFKVDMSLLLKKRGKNDRLANDTAITEKEWSAQWTAEKVFAYAQECVSKSATGEFAHGNRNKFLVRLAMMLSDFGMEQEHAAQLMEQEYASQYGEESIPSLVSGCYKSGAKMHGRRALPDARGKKSGERKGDVK